MNVSSQKQFNNFIAKSRRGEARQAARVETRGGSDILIYGAWQCAIYKGLTDDSVTPLGRDGPELNS